MDTVLPKNQQYMEWGDFDYMQAPRHDGAEIGVESADTVRNVEMSAVGCLGIWKWNPDIAKPT